MRPARPFTPVVSSPKRQSLPYCVDWPLAVKLVGNLSICSALLLAIAPAQTPKRVNSSVDTSEIRSINSHYFQEYASLYSIPTLLNLPANADKATLRVVQARPPHTASGSGAAPNSSNYLVAEAANADLVITGRTLSHVSSLTSDEDFVFTDYIFSIESVEKDDTQSVAVGDHIVVTRAGGSIAVNGKTVYCIDPAFPAFNSTKRYTLFLHKLPSGTAFKVVASGAYGLEETRIRPSAQAASPLNKNENEFAADVRDAVRRSKVQ